MVKNEVLMVNIGSTSTGGKVLSVNKETAHIQLTKPVWMFGLMLMTRSVRRMERRLLFLVE